MPSNPRLSGPDTGLTTLELAISVVVLVALIGMASMTLGSGFSAWNTSNATNRLERNGFNAVSGIAEQLSHVGRDTLLPQGPAVSGTLTFRSGWGYEDGKRLWGPLHRIEWRPSPEDPADGRDNDGDGIVDEGVALLIVRPGEPGEQRVVLVRNVSRLSEGEVANGRDDNGNGLVDEPGLLFDVTPEMVSIRLTLVKRGTDGASVARTSESSVSLRN